MTDRNIQELICIAKSAKNNMQRKYKGIFKDQVEEACQKFCDKYDINITHGSAYKEVCHKYYYYVNKYVMHFIANREDLYDLRKQHILTDKEIIDKILYK